MSTAAALRRIQDLPGPRGWPLLGNTLQVTPARIHLDVEAWAREFGPLFRIQLGRNRQLVVADHELLAAAMRERPEGFRRSPFTSQVGAEMGLPQGLFGAEVRTGASNAAWSWPALPRAMCVPTFRRW